MANRASAPMRPPVTELSSPMMAFCTVFEIDSSTTRSNGFNWASCRLPNMRRQISTNAYTMTGRSTFSSTLSFRANMSGPRPARAVTNIDTSSRRRPPEAAVLREGSHRLGDRAMRPARAFGVTSVHGHSSRVRLRHRERDKLRGRMKTDLLADVLAMIVDREDAQVQRLRDLAAGFPLTYLL